MNESNNDRSILGLFAATWGVVGFSLIMLDAINRLARIAVEAFSHDLTALHWISLLLIVIVMAYSEGYRGFQKSFSPRTAARAYYLYQHPQPVAALLAPLFCMGFFQATRAPLLFAWVGTALIVMLIIILQVTPQPWRGLIDVGVVVGLSWGLISFWVSTWRVFVGKDAHISPKVPGHEAGKLSATSV